MLKNKRVLVCGAGGFIGLNLIKKLLSTEALEIISNFRTPRKHYDDLLKNTRIINGDLTNEDFCLKCTKDVDYLIIANAVSFGLSYTKDNPLELINANTIMNINLLKSAYKNNVEKVIYYGSSVEYGSQTIAAEEKDIFIDHPIDVYFSTGWAKRYMEVLMRLYSEKLGIMSCGVIRLTNAYGPYDKFLPEHSNIMPALIKKFVDQDNPLTIRGNGSQSRDFIYIDDVTDITIKLLNSLSGFESLNVGSGNMHSINEVIEILSEQENFYPNINYLEEKLHPDPIRILNVNKMKKILNRQLISLNVGIAATIDWYKNNLKNIYR